MARTNDVQFDRLIFEFLLRLHPDAETCSPKKNFTSICIQTCLRLTRSRCLRTLWDLNYYRGVIPMLALVHKKKASSQFAQFAQTCLVVICFVVAACRHFCSPTRHVWSFQAKPPQRLFRPFLQEAVRLLAHFRQIGLHLKMSSAPLYYVRPAPSSASRSSASALSAAPVSLSPDLLRPETFLSNNGLLRPRPVTDTCPGFLLFSIL